MFASGQVPTGGALQTTTTFYDPYRTEPDGDWDRVDAWMMLFDSQTTPSVRRVTGWSASNSLLAFAPAVSATFASGSSYSLFKMQPSVIDGAINAGLLDINPERRITTFATAAEPDQAGSIRTIAVPTAIDTRTARLLGVERSVGTTNSSYDYERLTEGYHYDLLENNGYLTMILNYSPTLNTVVRFIYDTPLGQLSADSDSTEEPPNLVRLAARKYLALADGDDAAVARWGRELEAAKADNVKNTLPIQKLRIPIIKVH